MTEDTEIQQWVATYAEPAANSLVPLLEHSCVAKAMGDALDTYRARLASIVARAYLSLGVASPASWDALEAEVQGWYREFAPVARVLAAGGYQVPIDAWHEGPSAQACYIEEWAGLLPRLVDHFRLGAPLPTKSVH